MLLVMCECSQVVTSAFRSVGVEAYSCDLQPSYGDLPQYHFQMDCFECYNLLHPDFVICHPPCTYLTNAGSKYFLPSFPGSYERWYHRMDAIGFFYRMVMLPSPYICIENPSGVMSRIYRRPDQIVHPFQFGDSYMKRTGLWLKGLPHLVVSREVADAYRSNWLHLHLYGATLSDSRSHTSVFLADQMARQWSAFA